MSPKASDIQNTSQPSTVDEPENHQQSSDEDNENSISEAGGRNECSLCSATIIIIKPTYT